MAWSKKAAWGLLAVLAIAQRLETEVWLGAATIELERTLIRKLALHKRRVLCPRRAFAFVASVVTPLGDYCFSDFAKNALAVLDKPSRQARASVQPLQVVRKRCAE